MALIVALLVGGGLWYAWSLWRSPPLQWASARQAVAALTPQERRTRAAALEERVIRELSFTAESIAAVESGGRAPGVDGPSPSRAIRIDPLDANAWLHERFPDWAANQDLQLPAELTDFTLWVEDGRPVFAGRYRDQVFSLSVAFEVLPDGKATVRPVQLRGGQVQLPVESLVAEGAKQLHDRGHADRATALRGQPFDPVIPIDDGRQARVVGFDTDGGSLNLHVRAEPSR